MSISGRAESYAKENAYFGKNGCAKFVSTVLIQEGLMTHREDWVPNYANLGTPVKWSEVQNGDVVILDNWEHIGIYVNGKIIHDSTSRGYRIGADNPSCFTITAVRRFGNGEGNASPSSDSSKVESGFPTSLCLKIYVKSST